MYRHRMSATRESGADPAPASDRSLSARPSSDHGSGFEPPPHRVVRWPAIVALALPATLIVLRAPPLASGFLYFIVMLALLVVASLAAVSALPFAVEAAWFGRWRRAASFAVLPVLALSAALLPWSFLRLLDEVGDTLHFQLARPYYQSVVAALPETGAPKLAVFDWGGVMIASHGVVYDESDEVALPPERQSRAWQARASRTTLSCEGYFVAPLGAHFYLGEFSC
jgi:hypothetical protein